MNNSKLILFNDVSVVIFMQSSYYLNKETTFFVYLKFISGSVRPEITIICESFK